jgi:hypothetical protein
MLLITTAILALCFAIWAALLFRLAYSFRHLKSFTGAVIAIMAFGSFAWVFGVGAYKVSSMVIDGMIARIALLF